MANGTGGGSSHTNAALFTNLETYVSNGGKVFVTGYDSVASPTDSHLVSFLGGTGSRDFTSGGGLGAATGSNSLTTGVVDIQGVTPTGGYGDQDKLILGDGATAVSVVAGDTDSVWTLRSLGSGEIAYVSNGQSGNTGTHGSWSNTAAGGDGAYNAALRNFVQSAAEDAPPVALRQAVANPAEPGVTAAADVSLWQDDESLLSERAESIVDYAPIDNPESLTLIDREPGFAEVLAGQVTAEDAYATELARLVSEPAETALADLAQVQLAPEPEAVDFQADDFPAIEP